MRLVSVTTAVRGYRRVLCGAVALGAIVAADGVMTDTAEKSLTASTAGDAVPGTAGATSIPSVTVTARRRDENEQDVPIPIATVDGGSLDRNGVQRVEELSRDLPSGNLLFMAPRQTTLSVRGLGNNPANDALESDVGVYVDGVYLGRPGMVNADLTDIDQVSFLEGPQGTLFGKNTTAGVLSIATRLPSFEPEASAEVSAGSYGYGRWRGMVSGPLIDNSLAGRLTLSKSRQDGFVNDLIDGRKLNGYDRDSVRGQLLFVPLPDLTVRVIGDYEQEDSDCCISVPYSFGPPSPTTLPGSSTVYPYVYVARAVAAGADPTPQVYPSLRSTTINDPLHFEIHQGGASAEVNWTLPGLHKLTSITAYRSWGYLPVADIDGISAPIVTAFGQGVDDKQFSQELRMASPAGGDMEYLLGAYYFFQNQDNRSFTLYGPTIGDFTPLSPVGVPPIYGLPYLNSVYSQIRSYETTDSISAFTQASWRVRRDLRLTAGIRETFESKSQRIIQDPPTADGAAANPVATNLILPYYDSGPLALSNYDLSALLSVDYRIVDDVLGYASVSRGAKSGGINATVPPTTNSPGSPYDVNALFIEPEKATDAELGLKSIGWNRRVMANINGFWTLVKDYQAANVVQVASARFASTLANIGYVRTQGVETEIRAIPLKGLTLTLTAAYNDAIYRSYTDAPCGFQLGVSPKPCTLDLSGSRLVGAPRWLINPGIAYDRRLAQSVVGYATGQYSWRSSYFGIPDDSPYANIAAYGVYDFRIGASGRHGSGTWDISLWAKNAFDKHYVTGGISVGEYSSYYMYPGSPRIVGATLRLDL